MDRKKKLKLIQISLLILGSLIIFFTYLQKDKDFKENIISKEKQEKIKKNLANNNQEGDVFFDVSYSGLDLSGNRYILKSKEAESNKSQAELVFMKTVNAFFYFKDDTILEVRSKKAIYNNKSLNIKFNDNVEAFYEGSTITAEKAEYSNSNNYLSISEKVIVKDVRGEMFADNLFFDLKKNTLDIGSFNDNRVNANINLK
jgi:LPS export ABC transporter protein LptC|tara:strand:- start:306 stop:908 length:603 start_codon:yes stop_codon:yes gene_type:complete